jgi:hypothetical protein
MDILYILNRKTKQIEINILLYAQNFKNIMLN